MRDDNKKNIVINMVFIITIMSMLMAIYLSHTPQADYTTQILDVLTTTWKMGCGALMGLLTTNK